MGEEYFDNQSGNADDILSILMGSSLYLELPLKERYMLLKHICEVYGQCGRSDTTH